MTSEARDHILLALVRTLYVNGQATAQMLDAGERLGQAMGLKVTLFVRWGELQLRSEDNGTIRAYQLPADPTGVEMARVAAAMREVDDLEAGAVTSHAAAKAIEKISRDPPAPTWLFALAAAAGAVALAVIFGVSHLAAAALIFVTAGVGAILRRRLARLSANPFVQPFCAALLAGFIGGIAVRYDLSSSLRLIAVCPCMILGARAAHSQWSARPGYRPHPSRSRPPALRGRDHRGDFDRVTDRIGASRSFIAD